MILSARFNLLAELKRFALRQSAEEIARAYSNAKRTTFARRALTLVVFIAATAFLPLWLCALLLACDFASDILGVRLLSDLDPGRTPNRYLAMLGVAAASQAFFCVIAVLCWQLPDPLARAFALGSLTILLVERTTMNPQHLPLALVGAATILLTASLANGWYGLHEGKLAGLVVSSAAIAAGGYFALRTILSAHRTLGEILRERAAAQAADQAKSRFLAQMSHELRTPLNAIIGIGSAELAVSQTPEGRERLAILVQSARGLSVMLDDILDLSAVQAGQLPIRPAALDLGAEITATVALFRQQIADAGLTLRFSLDASVPRYARLDGQRLRQCLSNLLSNAVKHTAQGMISVNAYEPQPGMLAIKVADSGPGVQEDLREKIFEPFYRCQLPVPGIGLVTARDEVQGTAPGLGLGTASGTGLVTGLGAVPGLVPGTVPGAVSGDVSDIAPGTGLGTGLGMVSGNVPGLAPGTGLGLSIARTLARRMGGDLVVLPSVAGADFLLTLAFAPAERANLPAPDPPTGVSLAGLRVLVVDDIATNRMVAATYLRALGATPVEAAGGLEALALLAGQTPPDMVLLDLLMPELDGRETLHRIRALPGEAAQIPVVAVSAEPLARPDPATGASPQFDGYVLKPLSSERLAAVLLPLAQRRAEPAGATSPAAAASEPP